MKTAGQWADELDDNPSGFALVCKEDIADVIQQALEAQHRKTWDMAMKAAEGNYYAPCPPLTNESNEG